MHASMLTYNKLRVTSIFSDYTAHGGLNSTAPHPIACSTPASTYDCRLCAVQIHVLYSYLLTYLPTCLVTYRQTGRQTCALSYETSWRRTLQSKLCQCIRQQYSETVIFSASTVISQKSLDLATKNPQTDQNFPSSGKLQMAVDNDVTRTRCVYIIQSPRSQADRKNSQDFEKNPDDVQVRWRDCSGSGWLERVRRTMPRARLASRLAC